MTTPTTYTSCGFESCTQPATGYAPVMYGDWHAENRSACDAHGSDGTLRPAPDVTCYGCGASGATIDPVYGAWCRRCSTKSLKASR